MPTRSLSRLSSGNRFQSWVCRELSVCLAKQSFVCIMMHGELGGPAQEFVNIARNLRSAQLEMIFVTATEIVQSLISIHLVLKKKQTNKLDQYMICSKESASEFECLR